MPDLAGTTWSFCGGNLGGVQMTQDDYDAALEPVSYTHLDVYKRKVSRLFGEGMCEISGRR